MDINFPFVLVLLVFASGVIWLLDALFFAPKRRASVAAVDAQFASLELEAEREQQVYTQARVTAAKEPLIVEYSKSFFPVLLVVLVLRSFIAEPFQIPSGSMIPTLEVGDFILVNKFTYGLRLPVTNTKVLDLNDPERGDVMVFFPPHKPDTYFIKRVVGLPGDHIRYANNVLYVNGVEQKQRLVAALPPAKPRYLVMKESLDGVEHGMQKNVSPGFLSREFETVVPEGHYFMMGDNRDNSSDSREWGSVPEEAIVGKAFAIWMHWESLFSLPSFHNVGSIQ